MTDCESLISQCVLILGGRDPLDHISMYANMGDPEQGISQRWHYVTF